MRYIRAFHRGLLLAAMVVVLAAAMPLVLAHAQIAPRTAYVVAEESAPAPQVQTQTQDIDDDSELPWLFAVFFVTWAAFFAYVFIMSRRQREMQRELDALKRALAAREDEAGSASGMRG